MAFSFAKVPNHYLEALARSDLTSLELKVALVVLRYSIGFNRKHCDRLTLRGIARQCDRKWGSNLRAAIEGLIARDVIALEEVGDDMRRRRVRVWLRSSKVWRLKGGGDGGTSDAPNHDAVVNPDIRVVGGAESAPSMVPSRDSGGAGSCADGGDVVTLQRQDTEKGERDRDNRDLRSPPRWPPDAIVEEMNGSNGALSAEQRREVQELIAVMYGQENRSTGSRLVESAGSHKGGES